MFLRAKFSKSSASKKISALCYAQDARTGCGAEDRGARSGPTGLAAQPRGRNVRPSAQLPTRRELLSPAGASCAGAAGSPAAFQRQLQSILFDSQDRSLLVTKARWDSKKTTKENSIRNMGRKSLQPAERHSLLRPSSGEKRSGGEAARYAQHAAHAGPWARVPRCLTWVHGRFIQSSDLLACYR